MNAKTKAPEAEQPTTGNEPPAEATPQATQPDETANAPAEGSNLSPAQLAEAEQQAVTQNALSRATEAFLAGDPPKDTAEADAQAQAQAEYDAQEKPKAVKKTFEHEGVKVSFPSDMSRSQAFIHLTKLTQQILSGAD